MEQPLTSLKNGIFLSLLLLPHWCLSQSKNFTEKAEDIALLVVQEELIICSKNTPSGMLEPEWNVKIITEVKTEGFSANDFIFFKILVYTDSESMALFPHHAIEYTVCVNSKSLLPYSLKNLQRNEVSFLVEAMRSSDSKYKHLRNPRRFSQTYFVEGIDFECLLKGIRKKQTADLAMRFPCLEHCLSIILVI